MTSPVLFEEIATAGGRKAGLATLNSPQTLNGLSLAMCKSLASRLDQWESDPAIAFVMLRGAGDKAFSAGGDLHGLYKAMQDNAQGDPWANALAREFFEVEYRLDYRIHTYAKPILCWGSGIVMGGGVGLMMGASHRVATETTRFAMPEISIGLFPDVGGTWMLSRLPGGVGNFLALTGAQLGADDCLAFGLADYAMRSDGWGALLARIQAATWPESPAAAAQQLRGILLESENGHEWQPGPLRRNLQAVRHACDGADFLAVCRNVSAWAGSEDPWLKRAAATFLAGSPGSARLSFTLLRRARLMSLADVFRQEYIAALQCGVQGDFQEGIRALLVDKDKQPKWNPSSVEHATDAWVQRYFQPPWPAGHAHPLADLGRSAG
ncbi:enoyl-CoA hydratase/isomerase family protein [Parapusillimonas granuli]|uniref:3-hydroxyisobutyryl-CoA hydrolase n=1 Tax=Parapusillimonas granuli TaxID=380911 RepID=A0A853G026_9BURK|nr:enoyl-CoA hydratase/isomerase family protein [Parapusillimonas granuli]MBB5214147.1 enoyl-CoA hydratase/carnithine racemase [Parapusillimonas granuli]MEB2401658.1 enoyl-CoA hydratase/isomerase family protein [Alcaligenaceae bacterium]NYT50568.1 enoyl-CoA hydratase/isomerase family protein [Parapusillimonas granuli]